MQMRQGIPSISELNQLKATELFQSPSSFNDAFLARHQAALAKYGRHWGAHPFRLWSRRWEYPFAANHLLEFAKVRAIAGQDFQVLDAGSGVTFFPYYICSRVPSAKFFCVDYDPTYHAMFSAVNATENRAVSGSEPRVKFVEASLQSLPLADSQLDAICCISVLEHTDNYSQIVDEFLRVLKPGGLFILTFDLSLDGKFTLPKDEAERLLKLIGEKFDSPIDLLSELSRMHEKANLTSDHVRRTEPNLLPWTFPVRVYKAAKDLIGGKGWTAGFRSRTVFCCAVTKRN